MEGFERAWPPMQNFGCANTRRYQCLSMYKVNSRNLCIRDNVIRLPAGSVVPRFEHPATMLSNKGNSSDAASTVFGAC